MDDMDVPNSISQRMISVASDELYFLTENEHQSLIRFVPAIDEWLSSKCGHHYSKQESKDHDELIDKSEWDKDGNELRLSAPEQNYKAILAEKSRNRVNCLTESIREEQISRTAAE